MPAFHVKSPMNYRVDLSVFGRFVGSALISRVAQRKVKIHLRALLMLCAASLLPATVAACTIGIGQYPNIPGIKLTGGADKQVPGNALSSWVEASPGSHAFDGTCEGGARIDLIPSRSVIPGITYTSGGKTYRVFDSGVAGVGVVFAARYFNRNGYSEYFPLENSTTTIYSNPGALPGSPGTMTYYVRAMLVSTGRLATGTYSISGEFGSIVAYGPSGKVNMGDMGIRLSTGTITVTAGTCSLTTPSLVPVTLPKTFLSSMPTIGSVSSESASFSMGLKCTSALSVYATMTDASNPANTGNALGLGPESTASGVGIQIFRSGQANPIDYGPDSSANGNVNQWFIGTTAATGGTFTLPFTAKYVKTASKIQPGSVKARSTITFSYQ